MTPPQGPTAPAQSVRPLELFFDLVFVFAITQIASTLAARPTGQGLARVTVLLAITWWMYGGYAWLTNSLDLERTRPRLLLLTGMAAFFVMSLAVPRAFEPGPWGLVLALAYLVVVTVHTVGFLGTSGRLGISRLGPLNAASALIVVAAGAGPVRERVWLLAAACVLQVVSPFIAGIGGFTVGVGHFVERHGLAVIILLGESIAEVGSAATSSDRLPPVLLGSLLALALSAAMWWLYFDREERDSERLLEAVGPKRRPRTALYSFGYAYLVMILGVVVTSVGMQKAIDSFGVSSHGLAAWFVPLGLALYLLGLACFRRTLSGGWPVSRLLGAVAVCSAGPVALWGAGWAALALATAVLVCLLLADARAAGPRATAATPDKMPDLTR
ncbi:low temperature requirement protein A [Streptomyces sp. PTM05]|uniref:Low temperature requirement protein A n=1 Tax=Streptantibioticus parmotrematis TaxID=2873249 RepID=A0ABS7QPN5_9ACTN|nr:low temperature requirement protein A [Streptantibioticus parmotrematis]MBY8885130.1 low temperature requirement protein A [Streptantibioticus parmotrematis]